MSLLWHFGSRWLSICRSFMSVSDRPVFKLVFFCVIRHSDLKCCWSALILTSKFCLVRSLRCLVESTARAGSALKVSLNSCQEHVFIIFSAGAPWYFPSEFKPEEQHCVGCARCHNRVCGIAWPWGVVPQLTPTPPPFSVNRARPRSWTHLPILLILNNPEFQRRFFIIISDRFLFQCKKPRLHPSVPFQ